MPKNLVLYFSVYNSTKLVAHKIAAQTGADLVEIEPVTPYDSNRSHYNSLARLAKQEHDENMRPAIKNEIDIDSYDNIFIGYPMWWYIAPTIINTFIEAYDFSGKKIILFATSGGSGFGKAVDSLQPSAPNTKIIAGEIFNGSPNEKKLKAFAERY